MPIFLKMILRISIFVFFLTNFFLTLNADGMPKLVLTTSSYALDSDPEFSCSNGVINGFLTLPAPMTGTHLLESVWRGPDGTVVEYSKTKLEFPSQGGQTAHIWVRLGREQGLLSSIRDQEAGNSQFSGEWRVDVKWDENHLIHTRFKVKC